MAGQRPAITPAIPWPEWRELNLLMSEGIALAKQQRIKLRAAMAQGGISSKKRGQGMMFDSLRHYSAGDEWRHIDWKVTARTGKPHTRQFVEEALPLCFFIIHQSASMGFGTRVQFKIALAVRLLAMLGGMALGHGAQLALLLVDDEHGNHAYIPPGGKKQRLGQMLRQVMADGGEASPFRLAANLTSLEKLSAHLAALPVLAASHASIYWIGDVAGRNEPSLEAARPHLARLASRHRIHWLMLEDLADYQLPKHLPAPLEDHHGARIAPAEINRLARLHEKHWHERLGQMEQLAKASHSSFHRLATSCQPADLRRWITQQGIIR